MTDGEFRGILLKKFYEVRHESAVWNPVKEEPFQSDETRTTNICNQLAEHGLIEWHAFIRGGGNGRITARGVDVIEGGVPSPIKIVMYDHSIAVHSSENVQIGSGNTQIGRINVGKIVTEIDNSSASPHAKAEAKSVLEKLTNNALLVKIFGAIFGG